MRCLFFPPFKFSFKKATEAVERGESDPVPALPLLLPRCQSSFPRFSSCIFITKAVHSSAGWVTSASHRLTGEEEGGGGVHVKQTPHKDLHPTCGMDVYEWGCLCSLVFINKDETVFFPPGTRRSNCVFIYRVLRPTVNSPPPPFLKIEFL